MIHPVVAASAGQVGEILVEILIVLVAAKLAAEVAERIRVPAVVAEILAGAIIGPSVFGLVGRDNDVLLVFAEIGVILLLLEVGLEMNLRELASVGRAAVLVGIIGVVVPMTLGIAVAEWSGKNTNVALFMGATLAATSVGITARVFSDMKALGTVEARTVLGAAVVDDILALVVLTVVSGIATKGSVSALEILQIVGVALGFLVVMAVVGLLFAPRLFQWLHRVARAPGTLVAIALAFTLALSELASAAKLAPIVGAFLAGLALSQSTVSERIRRDIAPIGHIMIPVFFLQIGISVDLGALVKPEVLIIAGVFTVLAVIGKLAAVAGMFGARGDKLLVGIGMVPRGEVGLIFAAIGRELGVLNDEVYGALLLVVLLTTLLTPPVLKLRLQRVRRHREAVLATGGPPPGGWLSRSDEVVELAGQPPPDAALALALAAAGDVTARDAGPRLCEWLADVPSDAWKWDSASVQAFDRLLRTGNARSWRFLESTGVLEGALPEMSAAIRRRQNDPFVLDPVQVLKYDLVERLRTLDSDDPAAAAVFADLAYPDWLMLAALVLDSAGEAEPRDMAAHIVARLDLGEEAGDTIARYVSEPAFLRAAATGVGALDEDSVYRVAATLDRPELVRGLFLLGIAKGDLPPVERASLDELLLFTLALLGRPDLSGTEARSLMEARRQEALVAVGDAPTLAARIDRAPREYLLSHEPADIARHVAFMEPLPRRGRARVSIVPGDDGSTCVEVTARDRSGLLAAIADAIEAHDGDVVAASIATWPDGGVLDAFAARFDGATPSSDVLAGTIRLREKAPTGAPPNPDIAVRFDDESSPWSTICEVRTERHRQLMRDVAVAFTAAGATVTSANLNAQGSTTVGRFEVTSESGEKLDGETKVLIERAIHDGVFVRRGRFGRGRRMVIGDERRRRTS